MGNLFGGSTPIENLANKSIPQIVVKNDQGQASMDPIAINSQLQAIWNAIYALQTSVGNLGQNPPTIDVSNSTVINNNSTINTNNTFNSVVVNQAFSSGNPFTFSGNPNDAVIGYPSIITLQIAQGNIISPPPFGAIQPFPTLSAVQTFSGGGAPKALGSISFTSRGIWINGAGNKGILGQNTAFQLLSNLVDTGLLIIAQGDTYLTQDFTVDPSGTFMTVNTDQTYCFIGQVMLNNHATNSNVGIQIVVNGGGDANVGGQYHLVQNLETVNCPMFFFGELFKGDIITFLSTIAYPTITVAGGGFLAIPMPQFFSDTAAF